MKVCIVMLVLYLLTSEQVLAQSSKAAKSANCPKDLACDKLGADCTVTVGQFQTQIVNKTWLAIDAVAFPALPDEGKVKHRWTPIQTGATVTRETSLGIPASCPPIIVDFNFAVTDCGIELRQAIDGHVFDAFCSQDLTKYLILYTCVDLDEDDICHFGYVGLHVPDTRFECTQTMLPLCPNGAGTLSEPDLTILPWDQINQDWFKSTCAYFPNAPFPTRIWKGDDECDFQP